MKCNKCKNIVSPPLYLVESNNGSSYWCSKCCGKELENEPSKVDILIAFLLVLAVDYLIKNHKIGRKK